VAITGASSGIGATFARKLAPGHDLLLIARRRERLEQLANEISAAADTQIDIFPADLTVEAELKAVAKRIEQEPRLALLINNAGFGTKGRFWEAALKGQEQMHKLHVLATVDLTHAALRNIVRSPGSTSYSATKTWMTAFTEGLYLELQGIRSNVVVQALCPGFTYSEFHDRMGVSRYRLAGPSFWMTAEEVVEASLNGLRTRKLFVIPGWRYRLVAGIFSKLPSRIRLAAEAIGGRARLREAPPSKALDK
jgi:hypothetical protein